jgi:hypothetical protein
MRYSINRVLGAAVSMLIIVGPAVQSFAQERAAVPPGTGFQQDGQERGQPSLAEQYLFRLAKTSKAGRRVGGDVCLAAGGGLLAYGLSMLNNEEDTIAQVGGLFVVLCGGGSLAAGTFLLARQSPTEQTYRQIQAIADPAQRERACEDALAMLAKKGRKGRISGGGLLALLAVSAAASMGVKDSHIIVPASLGAVALYSLLVKSPAEKANRAYLQKRPLRPTPTLIFGLAPGGGFRLSLSTQF